MSGVGSFKLNCFSSFGPMGARFFLSGHLNVIHVYRSEESTFAMKLQTFATKYFFPSFFQQTFPDVAPTIVLPTDGRNNFFPTEQLNHLCCFNFSGISNIVTVSTPLDFCFWQSQQLRRILQLLLRTCRYCVACSSRTPRQSRKCV